MNPIRAWLGDKWPLLILLLTAAIWFYRSPYSASNLEIVPDSEEYAIGAMELLETGHFHLTIEDRWVPPRYPPWFSAVVIAPAYVLFGHQVGNGIIPIIGIAVAGVGFAWGIGRRVSGTAGGIFAALAVLIIPSYSIRAGQIMTDVPCTALMLATCLLYLQSRERPQSLAPRVAAGLLVALTALFRTVFGAMLLPFLYDVVRLRSGRVRSLLALVLPMSLAAAATFAYNAATFGSPLRNGYKVWAAIPLDYLSMTFSAANIPPNLIVIWNSPFPILLVIALIAWLFLYFGKSDRLAQSRATVRDLLVFFGLTVGPVVAFHLLYFYRSDRFYLPLFAGTGILAGSLAALAIGRRAGAFARLIAPAVLLLAIYARVTIPEATPHRRLAAERIRKFTPTDAIVISTTDPVYLEHEGARGSHRRIVPLSRRVEYASKLLVWKRIPHLDPPPRGWREVRPEGLRRGGADDAVKFVATEQLDAIAADVQHGKPAFVDITMVDAADRSAMNDLARRFAFVPRAPWLYQLVLR